MVCNFTIASEFPSDHLVLANGLSQGHTPILFTALPTGNSLQLPSRVTFGHLLPASVLPQAAQPCPNLGSSSTCPEAVDGSPSHHYHCRVLPTVLSSDKKQPHPTGLPTPLPFLPGEALPSTR